MNSNTSFCSFNFLYENKKIILGSNKHKSNLINNNAILFDVNVSTKEKIGYDSIIAIVEIVKYLNKLR